MKKADRYKDSPTLKRDDADGKMKATKKPSPTEAEKATSEDASGTAGMPVHEVHAKQERELFDLYQRHQKEYREVHDRHRAEGPADTNTQEGA